MPGRKPTAAESEERLETAYQLLAAGHYKFEIKRRLREKYKKLDHRTIEGYLARARERMLMEVREEKITQRAASLAFYRSVIAAPLAETKHKLTAQKQIDRLLGLPIPVPVRIDGILTGLGISPDEVDSVDRPDV